MQRGERKKIQEIKGKKRKLEKKIEGRDDEGRSHLRGRGVKQQTGRSVVMRPGERRKVIEET